MKTIKRLGSHVSAAILAATLGMPVAVGVFALASTPAYAQTTLSSAQLSAIQTSLTAALQAAQGDSAAIEAAISQAVQNAIALYGSDAAAAITSEVISVAESLPEQFGVSQNLIGVGLADAAAAESVTNVSAATAIATTVANEGRSGEILAFQASATSLGYANLASIAGSGGTPTGETGGGGGGGGGGLTGGSFGGGGGGGGGGCLNPSCTKL